MNLNGFTRINHGEFLKWHISQLVATIKSPFVALLLGFGGLRDDIFFCHEVIIPKAIKETATANSTRPCNTCTQVHNTIGTVHGSCHLCEQ